MNKKQKKHYYLLPDGSFAGNQLEGCKKLGIGRNSFRNKVKSGVIKKLSIDKPNGYGDKTDND